MAEGIRCKYNIIIIDFLNYLGYHGTLSEDKSYILIRNEKKLYYTHHFSDFPRGGVLLSPADALKVLIHEMSIQ